MYDEFRCLSILIKECPNENSFLIIQTLHELLIFEFDVFQSIYLEADIYLSLQMKFLSLLNLECKGLANDYRLKKDQQLNSLIKILRLLLKNNKALISSFLDIGHFEILLQNLPLHKRLLSPFILFFLDEEAKNVNLQPYLDFLISRIENLSDISDYPQFFTLCSILIKSLTLCESKKVFREALLKRFAFFDKYYEALCILRTLHPVCLWTDEKQRNLLKGIIFIRKHLLSSGFLRKYFQKKGLFFELIQRLISLLPYFKGFSEDILIGVLRIAIIPIHSLPMDKDKKGIEGEKKEKSLNFGYFNRKEGFFLLFPEIIKALIEGFIRKCDIMSRKGFWRVLERLSDNMVNRDLLNKGGIITAIQLGYPDLLTTGFEEVKRVFLKVFEGVCEGNFNVKIKGAFEFIIEKLIVEVIYKPRFFNSN